MTDKVRSNTHTDPETEPSERPPGSKALAARLRQARKALRPPPREKPEAEQ